MRRQLKAAPQMDERICPTRKANAALAMSEKQRQPVISLVVRHSFGNEAPPKLPYPDGPWRVGTRLAKKNKPRIEQPTRGRRELSGAASTAEFGNCS